MLSWIKLVGAGGVLAVVAGGAAIGLHHRCPCASSQTCAGAPDGDGDVQVSLDQCPVEVVATIAELVGDGMINEIELAPSGNYEIDATMLEGSFDFVVAADGQYLGFEQDDGEDGPDDDD